MATHDAAKPAKSPQRIVKPASSSGFVLRLAAAAAPNATKSAAPTKPRIATPTNGVDTAPATPMARAPAPATGRCGRAPALRHSRADCNAADAAVAEYSTAMINRPPASATTVSA